MEPISQQILNVGFGIIRSTLVGLILNPTTCGAGWYFQNYIQKYRMRGPWKIGQTKYVTEW